MKLCEIAYNIVKRDPDGMETYRKEERVYLRLMDEIADAAKQGQYDFGLTLTMQHIAELQGYSFAGITDITY